LLPSRPYLLLFLIYLLSLVFFAAFRALFLISFSDHVNGVSVGEILTAFLVGVRFDQIVILMILAPLLLVLPWISLRFTFLRGSVLAYLGITFSACFLLLVADIPFFKAFDSRLNFLVIDYLSRGRTAWHLVFTEPRFYWSILIWMSSTVLFLLSVWYMMRRTRHLPHRFSWTGQVLLLLLCGGLTVLGIRGRTGLSPISWGAAYFSRSHLVNQLGLNGVFTLGRAFLEEGHDPRLSYLPESERFPFVPFSKGLSDVRRMLHQGGDQWLEPDSSLRRLTRQPPSPLGFAPNLIIVLMESWSGRNTGALGSTRDLTPNFDRLADQGILFTSFYANGTRTNYGMAATLCSYPSIPGRSVMTRYNALHPFISLPEILHDRGYFNGFAYGGDLAFDNLEGFFTGKKVDHFYGESYFGREHDFAKWGIPDHIVFEKTAALTDSLPRPFQLTVLTLSNHEPFDLPDSSLRRYFNDADSSKKFNAFLYADFAVGRFIEHMRRRPVFDSTLFVFTADHAHFDRARLACDPVNFHAPLLIYSPALLGSESIRIDKTGSQVDLLPTLMGLLGDDYTHAGWGRDLLRLTSRDQGFAVLNVLNWVGYVGEDYYYMEHIGRPGSLFDLEVMADTILDVATEKPEQAARLQRRLHSYLQIAEQLSTPGSIE
jgi:hypothetical protein